MVKVREDMTGWKMWEHGFPDSRITVVRQVEDKVKPSGRHVDMWECQCNCGNEDLFVARGSSIKDGSTKSCGCLQKEVATVTCKQRKKYNRYDLSGEYGIGWTSNTDEEFYFDLEDYDKIKDYCWSSDRRGYVGANINQSYTRMHKFLGFSNYDHVDRNGMNNQKSNLRQATYSQNAQNHGLRKDNSSGVIGVCWNNNENKWVAYVRDNQQSIHLGYFKNKEDAIIARLKAEKEYYGEFAPQKNLFDEYGISRTQN